MLPEPAVLVLAVVLGLPSLLFVLDLLLVSGEQDPQSALAATPFPAILTLWQRTHVSAATRVVMYLFCVAGVVPLSLVLFWVGIHVF